MTTSIIFRAFFLWLTALVVARGFSPARVTISTRARQPMALSSLRMSASSNDEVAKLRAAAAKARDEAAKLAKELGKEDSVGAVTATASLEKATKSPSEVATAIRSIDFSASARAQVDMLDALRKEGCLTMYKSATVEAGSGDLRYFPVSLSMLEQRSGLTAEKLGIGEEEVSLDDFKYVTLYVTGGSTVVGIAALALLPENVGATVCYIVALVPILWLGVGSTAPAVIAGLIAAVKGSDDGGVSKVDRVCRHEAAHFLVGYLCGLPVANYETTDDNVPRVEFHYSKDGPSTSLRELSEDEVNSLTAVALSGCVAEAMEFGNARGSNSDLIELQSVFRQSENFLGAEKQQGLTRWGALTAYRLLSSHKDKLDALVRAFQEQKTIAECVAVLEQ